MFVFGFHNSVGFNQKLEELEKPPTQKSKGQSRRYRWYLWVFKIDKKEKKYFTLSCHLWMILQ